MGMSNLRDRIDAVIRVNASYGDDGVKGVIVIWEGGEIAGISNELLEKADEGFFQRDGEFIQIADLRVKIVDFDERVYLVKRVTDADTLV